VDAAAFESQRLATPTAFEWVALSDGAALVFAPRDERDGAVVRLDFARDGTLRTAKAARVLPAALVQGEVTDLAATMVGQRLSLAWVERERGRAHAFAAFIEPGVPERRLELGLTFFPPRAARGNVSVVQQGDKALLFARMGDTACVNPSDSACSGFSLFELSATGARPVGLPLAVPAPCADHSALLAVVGERFHYALCAGSEAEPKTTWFSIQRDPEYARADELLASCRPLGAFSWDGAAYLVGDCAGGRRFARVPGGDERIEEGTLGAFACEASVLSVAFGERKLVLREPRTGLHALLSEDIVPRSARAVWTGSSLLVADAPASRLAVSRFTCEGAVLRRAPLRTAPAPAPSN
jgi:hypothetical protein